MHGTKKADYRKINDRSLNSSTYHKKDGTPVRARINQLMKNLKANGGRRLEADKD